CWLPSVQRISTPNPTASPTQNNVQSSASLTRTSRGLRLNSHRSSTSMSSTKTLNSTQNQMEACMIRFVAGGIAESLRAPALSATPLFPYAEGLHLLLQPSPVNDRLDRRAASPARQPLLLV